MGVRSTTLFMMTIGLACRPGSSGAPAAHGVQIATLSGLYGAVDVLRMGAVDWTRVQSGAPLYDEDRVRTFKDAWAQLNFVGGSMLRLEEESLISLGEGVFVERGTVGGELQAGLRLKTPALEAEVAPAREIEFR